MRGPVIYPEDQDWATEYHQPARCSWKIVFRLDFIGACLAITGRFIMGPIAIILLFTATDYLTDATILIKADSSFFAFTAHDMSLAGGCTACSAPCKIGLLKYSMFYGNALAISPIFNAYAALNQEESLYDFSPLSNEALALAKSLDATGAKCQSGTSDWGSTYNTVTGTAQQVMDVILVLNLSVAPQMIRELEVAIEHGNECISTWNILGIARLFQHTTTLENSSFGQVSAVDLSIFPDFTECRPVARMNESLVGSKLALATHGVNLVAVVPEILTLFPYIFLSSIPSVSRIVPAIDTTYGAKTVVEPQLRAYYGGCRVREVNTTGVYIEAGCEMKKHWEAFGLMIHSPDDISLCSTSGVCVHNYYNSNWEWINVVSPNRTDISANTFRSRYGDAVKNDILPGIVMMQMFFEGIVNFYQAMSHKRSVLLTQIWTYRCQVGRMQAVYLAQITYHLLYNSDLYLLGLATGTLTSESIANLSCSLAIFSYAFINMAKARSGDQILDRHFRLTWEAMQFVITTWVRLVLNYIQRTPLDSIIAWNAEILRKNSPHGDKYCGLNDACILFTVCMPVIVALLSAGLGVTAIAVSVVVKKLSPTVKRSIKSFHRSLKSSQSIIRRPGPGRISAFIPQVVALELARKVQAPTRSTSTSYGPLTSFEENCIGAPFKKLFHDCDDFAYTTYNGKRCTTVEALLLSGYLYYGEHIYEASSVLLLLVARVIPRQILRSFNVLLLRWRIDPKSGTLSHALPCTWYTASVENHKLTGVIPIA